MQLKLKKIKNFDILLSTDSKKNFKKTEKFKYNYNYIRPKSLSGDRSLVIDAILHGIKWYELNLEKIDNVLMLQPTNPYRIYKDFETLFNQFTKKEYSSYVSVIKMKEHPSECIYYYKNKWDYIVSSKKNYSEDNHMTQTIFLLMEVIIYQKKIFYKNISHFL